jgi:taspase (threonine aspartase 1)
LRKRTSRTKLKNTDDTPGAFPDGSVSPVCLPDEETQETHLSKEPPQSTENQHGIKRTYASAIGIGPGDHGQMKRQFPTNADKEDSITDTIGAIAVDERGHIAAGSSSGGIGMKHRGRLGPAALVGIGTAVVPCEEDDEDGVTVAAVTSGTGEHMATTMASQRCAERIYHGMRHGPKGTVIQDDDEDAIMSSFITNDFMNHPGVRNCHSAGAIGVMVVKKTRSGYYLYFAHNTDSFALASMGGLEKEARCTMSRLPEGATIAQGGRKVRLS